MNWRAFSRRRHDEIDEELAFHLESAENELKKNGLSSFEARRAARLHFGNPLSIRESIVANWLDNAWHDVRLAARLLAKSRATTAAIVLSLALGIGANTAIFTLAHALLLKTLPVPDPERLHVVGIRGGMESADMYVFSNPLWEAFERSQRTFSSVLAWNPVEFDLSQGGARRPLLGGWLSGSGFRTLGLEPALGRFFSEADDQRSGGPDGPVAVLGYDYWKSAWKASPTAVGATLRLNGKPLKVIGVAPAGFHGLTVGLRADVFVPIRVSAWLQGADHHLDKRQDWWLTVIGRLPPATSAEQAGAQLAALSPALADTILGSDEERQRAAPPLVAKPLAENRSFIRDRLRQPVLVLMAVAGMILLIACANVASLLLARAVARQRELAVRVALGAPRLRLARQMLTESLLLALAGAGLGLALAPALVQMLVRAWSPGPVSLHFDIRPDSTVLAFTAAVSVVCGLAFGAGPAWRAARLRPGMGLNVHGFTGAGRLRFALVTAQVALAVVLVSAAGLFLSTLRNLVRLDLGFRPDGVLLAQLDLAGSAIPPVERLALVDHLLDAARHAPGVAAASVSRITPLSNSTSQTSVQAVRPDGTGHAVRVWANDVSPGFFATLGTPLLAGRDFQAADRPVALVNRAFARAAFGGANPVGRQLRRTVYVEGAAPRPETIEIIGLVADAAYVSPRQVVPPTVYFPLSRLATAPGSLTLQLRSASSGTVLLDPLAAITRSVEPRLAYTPQTFSARVRDATRIERLIAGLCAAFGALALGLVALGLYGVLACTVASRRTEIGVRLALGASPGRIRRWVLGRLGVTLASGAVAGLGISLWVSRFTASQLYGVRANDLRIYALGLAVLTAVGLAAAWLPARGAANTDPMISLRCE
jgi:predicted permease